tara:strand:+ start:648 stop:1229 length:582 start_codon:yes stop_codon:yes gene_type:complete
LTNAITLIADHKGFTRPKVVGDDYIVLADCAISAYRTGTTATAASQTITAATSGDTLTRTAGSYLTDGFEVGDIVIIAGSASANNALLMEITALTATVLTTDSNLTNDTGGGNEVITHAGETITAASLGLSRITSVAIVGQNKFNTYYYVGRVSDSGDKAYIYCFTDAGPVNDNSVIASGNLGSIRLEVRGQI